MKNLLVIAVLTFGLSLGANGQDYSKGSEKDKDVTKEIKQGADEASSEIHDGAQKLERKTDKASTEIHDEAQEVEQKTDKASTEIHDEAQEVEQETDEASTEIHDEAQDLTADDPEKTQAERQGDQKDRSKAGNALNKTGSAVKDGASWTWDKAKHNKLTKNVFNQPGDE